MFGVWDICLLVAVPIQTTAIAYLKVPRHKALALSIPHREEPGHRSPMSVWAKYLVVLATIALLLTLKSRLGGFMTLFPMVGVVTAY
ncbi:MAG: hypothetical protein KAI66_24775 [Lentisphaeria bacterium]|nr:hypothetical protein [Lentisphaeria bacterium]